MRHLAAVILLLAGAAIGVTGATVTDAAPAGAATGPPPATVVAVRGGDDALWVSPADGTVGRWTSLGGRLASVPAVVRGPFGLLLFGVGTNQQVYVRTYGRGWTVAGPPGTRCLQIAASYTSAADPRPLVGCLAPNDQVYVGEIPAGSSAIVHWTPRGAPPDLRRAGLRLIGTNVVVVGRRTVFAGGGVSTVWSSVAAGQPWGLLIPPFPADPPASLDCAAPPIVVSDYFGACGRPDQALYWYHVAYGCATCGGEQISGVTAGRVVGLIAQGPEDANRRSAIFGLGTNGQVYRWTVRYTLVDRPAWTGPTRFTGAGKGGVAVG